MRAWAARPKHKPLVLRGARQVGKTTLVNLFAKDYEVYLTLNLEKPADRQLFESDLPMDDLVSSIYLLNRKERKSGSTLLFIDEIQNSPKAVALLRYFYEEVPDMDVIAAGSLLESLIDRHISFPVGRVEYMAVRPCSFNEFLGAVGFAEWQSVLQRGELPTALHTEALRKFNTFALIGGMPEVVQHYAEHKDFMALQPIYESLLTGYRDDVEKYAANGMRHLVRHILSVGWMYAAERIVFEKFGQSLYRSRDMKEAFLTLEKTMLLELAYPVTSLSLPMLPETKRSPKLLWFDTGLVNHVGGIQKEPGVLQNLSDVWVGRIAEQIVGQELLSTDPVFSHKRCFWVNGGGSEAEVDFVISLDDRLIPIEVKTGHNAHLRSLHQFMERANHDMAVRFWGEPFSINNVKTPGGKTFRLFNLPYYYAGCLETILRRLA